jgi:hypothetical protein
MRVGLHILATTLCLLAPALAHAQDMTSAATTEGARKSRLQASFGIASPVGEIGASYTYAPRPEVEFELGAGLGFTGFQLSTMPKLSFGNKTNRIVLGLGPSVSMDSSTTPHQHYVGYWLNGEVGYERRTPSGFAVLVAAGFTAGLAGEVRGHCSTDCIGDARIGSEAIAGKIYPQARIAFGRWF